MRLRLFATFVPSIADPAEQMKRNPTQETAGASSLDSLPAPRRKPGRQPLPRDEHGNIIRDKQV